MFTRSLTHTTSRGIIIQLCKITVIQFKTALGPCLPPYSQAAPQSYHHGVICSPIHPRWSNATVTHGSSHTHTPPQPGPTNSPWHRVLAHRPITQCRVSAHSPGAHGAESNPRAPVVHLNTPRSTARHHMAASLCACFFFSFMMNLPCNPLTFSKHRCLNMSVS